MRNYILVTLLSCSINGFSQIYPVQLNLQLNGVHPVYLPDLATIENDYLRMEIEFNDLSEPTVEAKLFIEVIGQGFSIRTSEFFQPEIITLSAGIPYLLSGAELGEYLKTENLTFSGMNPSDYEERKTFPEGQYTLCVKVIHYWNPGNVQISNEACVTDWFVLNDPPIPDLPVCGGNVSVSEPQDIFFQWTPLHLSSPSLTVASEYRFQLWEIFPENAEPEVVANSMFPLFTVTATETFYNYTLQDPALIEGKEYAWRVTVLDGNGASLFNNVGKSSICTFRYSSFEANAFEINLSAEPTSHRQVLLRWNTYSFINNYQLSVRKAGFEEWFEIISDSSAFRLNDLEPASTYEGRVKGVFGMEETEWSDVISFTTYSLPVYSCNSSGIPPDLLGASPLRQAHEGMIMKVGQFEMKTTSIQAGQLPGIYSGTGTIPSLLGVKLNVRFQSVFIDENQSITGGEVIAITEGINSWSNQWEYEDAWFFSGNADSIFTQNGIIYIITADGDTSMVTEDYSGGLLITDQNGDQWLVNPDGSVVPVPESGLLPVSNTPLNAQELEILSRALALLQNEYTENRKDSLNLNKSEQESILNAHLLSQYNSINAGTEEVGEIAIIIFNPKSSVSVDEGSQFNKAFKQKEFDANVGTILFSFSRELDTPSELNYLGRYLTVSGQIFSDFVTQKTAEGLTNLQIAEFTAQVGIKELVKKVVKKKMSY